MRSALRRRGRERDVQFFGWESKIDQIVSVYRGAAKTSNAHAPVVEP
jgi:hypothetical protein